MKESSKKEIQKVLSSEGTEPYRILYHGAGQHPGDLIGHFHYMSSTLTEL